MQPSWVYFFRDGALVRGAGYATREEALRRSAATGTAADSPDPHGPPGRRALEVARRVAGAHLQA